MRRIAQSDLLRTLQCHLVYVGDHPEILNEPEHYLKQAGLEVVTVYRYGDVAQNILNINKSMVFKLLCLVHLVIARFISSSWEVLQRRYSEMQLCLYLWLMMRFAYSYPQMWITIWKSEGNKSNLLIINNKIKKMIF